MINTAFAFLGTLAAALAALFSVILFSYKKGQSDKEGEQIKGMLEENKKINDLKNDQENLSGDDLIAYRNKLHAKGDDDK